VQGRLSLRVCRLWSSSSSRNNSSSSGSRASLLWCTSCPGRSSSGRVSAPPPWRSVVQVPPPKTIWAKQRCENLDWPGYFSCGKSLQK
jgi:hypothetical protein